MGPPLGERVWEEPPERWPSEGIGGRGGDISTLGALCGVGGGYRRGQGAPSSPRALSSGPSRILRAVCLCVRAFPSLVSAALQAVVIGAAPFIPGLPLMPGTQRSHLLSENGVPQDPDSAPSA